MNETIKTIQNHRSIRNFQDRNIEEEKLQVIIDSARSMPSSINGQQVSVVVIKDKEKKARLAELSGGQPWVAQCPVFLIFVADLYKTSLAAKNTGEEQVIQESAEGLLVTSFDGGLAMGGAIIAAESMGLGITPIGGIRNNPEAVIKLLNLPKYTFPLAGLVIGYPADTSRQKPRLPIETFRHDESYHAEALEPAIKNYDELMKKYLEEIGRQVEVDWSTQTSRSYKSVYFPKVYPALKKQGFLNDK
jgi:FMN reductase [NAD(P)H]